MECGPFGTDIADWKIEGLSADKMAKASIKMIDKAKKHGDIENTRMLFTDAFYIVGGKQDNEVPMAAVDAMKQVLDNYGNYFEYHQEDIGHDLGASKPIEGIKFVFTH